MPAIQPSPRLRTDERGTGFPRVFGGRIDIGAFEAQSPTTMTTVTSASPPSPSPFGTIVTFTATVMASTLPLPTGTVTFMDGSVTLGTGTLSNVSGVATATYMTTVTQLAAGTHTVTAVYGGDTNYNGSTSVGFSYVISQVATTTTFTSASPPSPQPFGTAVTFTATVTQSTTSPLPTGTVTFMDGTTVLGTGTLSNVAGVATATYTTAATQLIGGTHSITAVYGGDPNFIGSTSGSFTDTITPLATTITVASSGSPTTYGQLVVFTATVSVTGPILPTGSVTFFDGGTAIGIGTLSGNQAFFATATLSGGSHTITVVYNGDSNYTASPPSSPITQTVNPVGSSTTLFSLQNPSTAGESVILEAQVAPASGGGTPTGIVTFMDGTNTLGTGTLSNGLAFFNASGLSVGPHSLTAVYGGDNTFNGSTSPSVSQTVNPSSALAGSTTTLMLSSGTSVFGQPVTLTATVSGTSGTPTGTVLFFDGSGTLLGSTALSAGVATLTTATLGLGVHNLTAVYLGDSVYSGSSSSGQPETVSQASASTTLTGTGSPTVWGQAVTFTATVARPRQARPRRPAP